MTWRKEDGREMGSPWKGLLAGAVGGLVASWVMNRSHDLWRKLGARNGARASEQDHQGGSKEEACPQGGDDATANTAALLSRRLFHHEPTRRERQVGGALVHFGYGAISGAFYGGLSEVLPAMRRGSGMPYGAVVWVMSDVIMVPLLRLSKPPTAYPPRAHAAALASHLVYGLTLDLVHRLMRRRLRRGASASGAFKPDAQNRGEPCACIT